MLLSRLTVPNPITSILSSCLQPIPPLLPRHLRARGTALGYLAISGYDLYPKDNKTTFNTPQEYGNKLKQQVKATLDVTSDKYGSCRLPWTLGIPVSASAHEYETYTRGF